MKVNSKSVMKMMGTALAVCSAAAFMSSNKSNSMTSAKKSMKKTVGKVADFVDTVAAIM